MRQPRPSLGEIVRQSADLARQLADTARMHHEPDVALRFEEIAAAADGRARQLDVIAAYRARRTLGRIHTRK